VVDLLLIRSNDQKNVYGSVSEFVACEPPFWAAHIAAFVREKGITVEILDTEVFNLSPDDVVKKISSINPSVIGILVTGSNLSASTWKMHGAGILAKKIKNSMDTKIFMWGLHPSALPEKTLQEESIDFVIRGENFTSIYELVNQIKLKKEDFSTISGLFYFQDSCVKGNCKIELQENLDNLPKGAWDLLPMQKYCAHNWQRMGDDNNHRGYAVIATSLGCPFNCSFCAVSALFDQKKVRYKSAKAIVNEIDHLVKKYNVHYIKIIDECFVLNRKHVMSICDLLIEQNYDLNIWAYARIDTVDEELLDKLYKANVKWLCYGIESASDKSLGDVNKGQYNAEKIKKVVDMTHAAGINIIANYMFGLPEDDSESMQQTLTLARALNCEWINLCSTMAYPGSKLYFDCIKQGIELPKSWLGYSQYSYDCVPLSTNHLTAKDVLAFRDYAFNAFFENNDEYFQIMREKFGEKTVENIKSMLNKNLKRKLLES